ncbi:hypothetical protein HY484_01275 [Candidatus Woesearchaeota archaeon]|nr:hypothetical protein [Candidatus Woesearchaeota archaeon]
MNPVVKKDILDVIDKVLKALKDNETAVIGELSNHVIHDASIFQDDDSVSFAILIYSLSKTIERCVECGVGFNKVSQLLKEASDVLKSDDDVAYRSRIHDVFAVIQSADSRLKLYVEEVINKAKVKKGSKLHEHGISIARTAEILGIGQWELMSYVGKTQISEAVLEDGVKKRVMFARRLFA